MPDFLTPQERSQRMARIGSKNTAPEVALRRALHALGFRFRLDDRRLPGRPDIVFPKYGAIVFVHGCFWHRHGGCKVASTPKSNTSFWTDKFDRNVARDARAARELGVLGWRVFVAWECELGSKRRAAETAMRLASELKPELKPGDVHGSRELGAGPAGDLSAPLDRPSATQSDVEV
jgi:DNA mismatch endonuclease (patch repair protein)